MMDEHSLIKLHQQAIESVKGAGQCFNWSINFTCKPSDLRNMKIDDVAVEAAEWRAQEPTSSMYFTHRKYYADGIQHIIRELQIKPTSNRALYSLLSQDKISNSGDDPIPSFLTFQCSIENGNQLYCTATFRALEVECFFRVNLEEIRQNLEDICQALPVIEKINLFIFAFHAYCDVRAKSSLRKPKIELLEDDDLLLMLQDGDIGKLNELLGDLRGVTTTVFINKLETLKRNLARDPQKSRLNQYFVIKRNLISERLGSAIECGRELHRLRQCASRGENMDKAIHAFQAAIENIRNALR